MLVNPEGLSSQVQRTLAQPTGWVRGTTLRNYPARIRFLPAGPDAGRIIKVTHRSQPVMSIDNIGLANGVYGGSWTNAINPQTGCGIGVIEHPASAVVMAGLDNVMLHLDYPDKFPATPFYMGGKVTSVPLMTGTTQPYLKAINAAGTVEQNRQRRWLTVKKQVLFETQANIFVLKPRAKPGWSLDVIIEPGKAPWWQGQQTQLAYDAADADISDTFERIATARPLNGNWKNWLLFRLLTVGTGRKADFGAVYSPLNPGRPIGGQAPYQSDEAVRHRHLDLLGDLFFFGGWWQANITVYQGRHFATAAFRQHLLAEKALYPLSMVA